MDRDTKIKFNRYASRLLDNAWSTDDINVYLRLAVLAWNTAFIPKPERIMHIQAFIKENECPQIQLGKDQYDTLEYVVALVHIKKALFPEDKTNIRSTHWNPEKAVIGLTIRP